MTLSKVLSKYQVTLPREAVQALHIEQGDYLQCEVQNGQVLFTPVRIEVKGRGRGLLDQISAKWERLGVTGRDIDEAIRWARRRR